MIARQVQNNGSMILIWNYKLLTQVIKLKNYLVIPPFLQFVLGSLHFTFKKRLNSNQVAIPKCEFAWQGKAKCLVVSTSGYYPKSEHILVLVLSLFDLSTSCQVYSASSFWNTLNIICIDSIFMDYIWYHWLVGNVWIS